MLRLLVLATVFFASASSAQVIFQDGAFLDPDWTFNVETLSHPTGGSNVHEASGGNPDDHRVMVHGGCMGNNPCRIWTIGMRAGATYDPAAEGPIAALSYSEDQLCASSEGCGGGGVAGRAAILQGGILYLSSAPNSGVANNWQTLSLTGLLAADFGEFDIATTPVVDFGSNPDFSSSGAPIQFGFARGNSLVGAERTHRIDNWMVTVDRMPVSVEGSTWGSVKARYR